MTNKNKINQEAKETIKFFAKRKINLELSDWDISEIMSGLFHQQQVYGQDAPNQTPNKLRELFASLRSKK